jgi:hypothetical protein
VTAAAIHRSSPSHFPNPSKLKHHCCQVSPLSLLLCYLQAATTPPKLRSIVDRATLSESIVRGPKELFLNRKVCGPGPRTSLFKNNSLSRLFQRSCKQVPGLLGNQPVVQNFTARPLVLKDNSREVPRPRKNPRIALQTSNHHIFPATTPNSVILMPKIPESLLLLVSAFIILMFVAIICCLCLFALGTIVPEPFIADYQVLLFDESHFLFEGQQGKCPMIIFAPIPSLFCRCRTA